MAEEIEGDALGGKDRARVAGDARDDRAGADAVAVGDKRFKRDRGVHLPERRLGKRKPADHAGRARRDYR